MVDRLAEGSVGAWGAAPSPLAPLAYRSAFGSTPVPWRLAAAAGKSDLSLADLDTALWERLPWQVVPSALFQLLREQIAWFAVPEGIEIVPSGVDRAWLLGLPFRTRTLNSLKALLVHRQEDGGQLRQSVSASELLQVRGAGRMTVVDLLCVLEGMRDRPSLILPAGPPAALPGDAVEQTAVLSQTGRSVSRSTDTAVARSRLPEPLVDLLAGVGDAYGARTLLDALGTDLARLSAAAGIDGDLAEVDLATVTGGRSLATGILDDLRSLREDLGPRRARLLDERFYRRKPKTLQELGDELGITRERVRQLESKVKERLAALPDRAVGILAGALALRLDPVLRAEELDREIGAIFGGNSGPEVSLASRLVRKALGYRERDGVSLTRRAERVVADLGAEARRMSDDAGLFEEAALQAALPDDSWRSFWPLLVDLCGFHRIDGLLGLRLTKKARVKAAVFGIGRVATKAEIAERAGLTIQRTTSYLSGLEGVVRADRSRWGLAEWIEDAYDGVAGEILQRIDEDGGATRVERLFDELPRLFGTSEATIRANLGAPQFTVRDGFVRRVDPTALRLRPLDDVVDGRDEQKRPYFLFRVEERYLRGFSLAGLPPEIASTLGCEPNGGIRVSVRRPAGCGPVSVSWNLAALNGVSMGYLSDPLGKLGATPGENVRVVLLESTELEFQRHEVPHAEADAASAAEIIERMKKRRKVL